MKRRLSVVVTGGPTRERIDPVRFISNYSTGLMGVEIARAAAQRGHRVVLVSGPMSERVPSQVLRIDVESAREMLGVVRRVFKDADALIMAAAVADWRVENPATRKIKKRKGKGAAKRHTLTLIENPDILGICGRIKGKRVAVGFALETERLEANAERKLEEKNLDFIVANHATRGKSVFGDSEVDYLFLDRSGSATRFKRCRKEAIARHIIDKVETLCYSAEVR